MGVPSVMISIGTRNLPTAPRSDPTTQTSKPVSHRIFRSPGSITHQGIVSHFGRRHRDHRRSTRDTTDSEGRLPRSRNQMDPQPGSILRSHHDRRPNKTSQSTMVSRRALRPSFDAGRHTRSRALDEGQTLTGRMETYRRSLNDLLR
jgi:hypothetical protein